MLQSTGKHSVDSETHYKIIHKSKDMYNNLTYQILKLLKLLICFRKFEIKLVEGNE